MDEQKLDGILQNMRRYYNGYYFTNSQPEDPDDKLFRLYNPHLVFHYLKTLKYQKDVPNPEGGIATYCTMVLRSIANTGEFSVVDLASLVMTGSTESSIQEGFGT